MSVLLSSSSSCDAYASSSLHPCWQTPRLFHGSQKEAVNRCSDEGKGWSWNVKMEFDRTKWDMCGKRRMADGGFLWVYKAAGTEYAAGSTVNSGGDEHESYLLIWLHGNNGRDIETELYWWWWLRWLETVWLNKENNDRAVKYPRFPTARLHLNTVESSVT